MLAKRAFSAGLFLAFAVFSAGGPALHYAPFLGFHDCCNHQDEQDAIAICPCGQVHGQPQSTGQATIKDNDSQVPACDGSCLVCQFFSKVTFECVETFSMEFGEDFCFVNSGRATSIRLAFVPIFLQRGPPSA